MRSKRLNEEEWREMLLGNGTFLSRTNQIFRRLPSDPRCKLCHAPYGGVAGPIPARHVERTRAGGRIVIRG